VSGVKTSLDTDLGDAAKVFNKYFGRPSSPGYDAAFNIEHLMNATGGFWSYIVTGADLNLGVDGLRGMFDTRLKQLFDDVGGLFIGWEGALNQDGVDDATAYANGFFDTLNNRFGTSKPPAGPGSMWETAFHKSGTEDADAYNAGFMGTLKSGMGGTPHGLPFTVPASQLAGGGVHTTSITIGSIVIPPGTPGMPKSPTEWIPFMHDIQTASKMYDRFH
jgi:hypothetical protein